jgi:hypothetical protein
MAVLPYQSTDFIARIESMDEMHEPDRFVIRIAIVVLPDDLAKHIQRASHVFLRFLCDVFVTFHPASTFMQQATMTGRKDYTDLLSLLSPGVR